MTCRCYHTLNLDENSRKIRILNFKFNIFHFKLRILIAIFFYMKKPNRISNSNAAYKILKNHMSLDVEELWCVALGPGLQILAVQMIFRGTVDSCPCHPRDIFRFACLKNASQIIIAHNHPSNDPKPSKEDIKLTKHLKFIGQMIQIPVIDHLIITKTTFRSCMMNS